MTKPKKSAADARALRERMEAFAVRDGDCLIWRGAVNSSGHPVYNKLAVRRLLWTAQNGPLPQGKRLGCSCAEPLCIAKDHTVLRSYSETAKGQNLYTTARRRAAVTVSARARRHTKLTMEKARAIRSSEKSTRELADEYGISRWSVRLIKRGEIWREAANGASVFSWGGLAA